MNATAGIVVDGPAGGSIWLMTKEPVALAVAGLKPRTLPQTTASAARAGVVIAVRATAIRKLDAPMATLRLNATSTSSKGLRRHAVAQVLCRTAKGRPSPDERPT